MVTKSLIKLIDEAIIPALFLIIGKMAGLALAIYFANLPFTVGASEVFGFLPRVHFTDLTGYILAENYSNLAMFITASLGTIYVLVRAHFFHESHIHPKLHARLVALSLENLVAPSYHLYHQAAIWLTFLWLTVAFLLTSTILGVTYPLISAAAVIVAANFSWIFVVDVQQEIEISAIKS